MTKKQSKSYTYKNHTDGSVVFNVRLPQDLLEQVDRLTESGFESRSDAVRSLIQEGLDKEAIKAQLDYLQASLNRMSFIMEWIFKSSFTAAAVAQEPREIEKTGDKLILKAVAGERGGELMELSSKVLVTELVKRFGE